MFWMDCNVQHFPQLPVVKVSLALLLKIVFLLQMNRFSTELTKKFCSPSKNLAMHAASAFVASNEREQVASSQGEGEGGN